MSAELAPVRRALALHRASAGVFDFTGCHNGAAIGAAVTGMGLAAARDRAGRILAHCPVDHLYIVGVAGAIDPGAAIGDLVLPQAIMAEGGDIAYHPVNNSATTPAGILLSSQRLEYDDTDLAELRRAGIRAVDMESAAIAAACAERGCPLTVYRAISDRVATGNRFKEVFSVANADGSPNYRAALTYLLARPWRLGYLLSMGRGAHLAIRTSCEALLQDVERRTSGGTTREEELPTDPPDDR